ncbi:hypothetical protein AYO44_17395 [Planctomycetaceae bacterium SCGC AG-212-F19]|nr:hypothetical protein AYO44_17395 [Planctomycetaceae bacterium SCGC AG-212-F19]
MFSLTDSTRSPSRRDFLRIGSLGLGGLSLPWLLGARAAAAAAGKPLTTGKSVIFLFMHGGPSQFETFDPKMSAPDGNRCATGEIPTALPGITFGSTFERLAKLADKMAVVRSYRPGDANHDIKPLVHKDFLNANLGSIYARVAGMNHPTTGMPTNAALFPRAVDPATQKETVSFGNWANTGFVGAAYAPFVPGGAGSLLQNMQLKIPRNRLDDRRELLLQLDAVKRQIDSTGAIDTLDRMQEQAIDVILRGVADAFDLSKENEKTIARYDTAPLVPVESIDQKWNNKKNYADNAKSLGKLLLLARRLCEAGCGFVTVTTNFVWDMHADVNNAGVVEGMRYMGRPLDHAVSAFIEDLEARGLDEKILLVACGEMGRTPRLNKGGGRDHWGNLGPLLLYGGGLKMGQVIGHSTANGGDPATEPITPRHLVSTIMHTLFDVGEVRVTRGVPDDVARLITDSDPIPALVG